MLAGSLDPLAGGLAGLGHPLDAGHNLLMFEDDGEIPR
jgi:hypothetical protein